MSLISVIVPVYKAERYLDECIQSVLSQTHSDFELILVDDGSPDKSGEICDRYAKEDLRIKVIHTENGGVCRARNTGLDASGGEYYMFLDSDDMISKYALEVLFKDITENNADVAIGTVDSVDFPTELPEGNPDFVWTETQALEKSIEDNSYTYSSCAKLYKRETFKDVRFEEGRKIHEDSYYVFCCFLKKPVVTARDYYIYRYRNNLDSASHASFSDKYFDILYFAQQKKSIIDSDFPKLSQKANNILVKASLAMLHALCNTKNKEHNKCVKECIKTVIKYRKDFIPAYIGDSKWFRIVRFHMYGLFRILYRIKYSDRVK
ncbi:MAG: glycosyltransferase family 2 protein [Ruminococcaceae bacterium]|nr:glycosyltransferase family 2 protein [Oscillospiraceae bacterium]